MSVRPFAAALVCFLAAACSSTPPTLELDLLSEPEGATVYLSRRGEKAWAGKLGPVQGDVKAEDLVEDFLLIGTAPLTYTSLLRETESDATIFGVGGRVVLKFRDGVLRFEKPGFETVERHVRFVDGEVRVEVELPPAVPAP